MKKKIFCMVLAIMLVVGFIPSGTASAVGSDSLSTEKNALDFSDRHVIVTLTHEASLNFKTYTPDSFPEVACVAVRDLMQNVDKMIEAKLYPERAESLLSFNKDIQYSEMYERLDPQKYTQTLCLELKEPGKANVLAAVKLLLERDDILFAEPNYYYYAEATPNDPYHTDQWALNNIGLYGAWNISTGSTDSDSDNWLRIGIIDTGIDDSHPDLTNRVDPNLSTSFASYSYDTDLYGHGTHVAGLIGALVNNEIGISGTCWNVMLVSLKISNYGETSLECLQSAVNYATSHEIPILNYSFGGASSNASLKSTIDLYPGLFICSAGNDNANNDAINHYPSNYIFPNIIAVGASTESNEKYSESNFGLTSVDLFAPGDDLLTTDPCLDGCPTCYGYSTPTPGYHRDVGSSMATAYVTGVAALIKSKYPNLTPEQIKERILNSVYTNVQNGVNIFEGKCVSGGILHAYSAVHSHTLAVHNDYFATTHMVRCTGSLTCAYKHREEHTFEDNGTGYVCSACGYYSDSIPS